MEEGMQEEENTFDMFIFLSKIEENVCPTGGGRGEQPCLWKEMVGMDNTVFRESLAVLPERCDFQ